LVLRSGGFVIRICPICRITFEGRLNKIYCGSGCRRRAEVRERRRRKKEKWERWLLSVPRKAWLFWDSIPELEI
jgi:hypothetical protein